MVSKRASTGFLPAAAFPAPDPFFFFAILAMPRTTCQSADPTADPTAGLHQLRPAELQWLLHQQHFAAARLAFVCCCCTICLINWRPMGNRSILTRPNKQGVQTAHLEIRLTKTINAIKEKLTVFEHSEKQLRILSSYLGNTKSWFYLWSVCLEHNCYFDRLWPLLE